MSGDQFPRGGMRPAKLTPLVEAPSVKLDPNLDAKLTHGHRSTGVLVRVKSPKVVPPE